MLVDNTQGFNSFIGKFGRDILPGSVIDIADVKAEFRLRNDRTWEKFRSYAASEEEAAALEATAVAEILDTMIPDEEIEEDAE